MVKNSSIQDKINNIQDIVGNIGKSDLKNTDPLFQGLNNYTKDILQYDLPPHVVQSLYIANQVCEIFANEEVKKQQQEQEKKLVLKEKLEKIQALPKEKKITEFMLAYLYGNKYKLQPEGFSASNNGIKIDIRGWPSEIKMDISFKDPLDIKGYRSISYYKSTYNEGRSEHVQNSISQENLIKELNDIITNILSKKIQSL